MVIEYWFCVSELVHCVQLPAQNPEMSIDILGLELQLE